MLHRVILAAVCTTALVSAQGSPTDPYRFRVRGNVTPRQWQVIHAEFNPLSCQPPRDGQSFDVLVQPAQLSRFSDLGLAVDFLGQTPLDVPPPAGYLSPPEIEALMDELVLAHPTLAKKVNLSALPGGETTHDDDSVWALKISDNVSADEDEPAMLFAAQHHARETNSPIMVTGAMQRVLDAYGTDPTLTSVVDGYELYFVPCVNPDGSNHVWCCDTNWRKNRRDNGGGIFGVDNNRNYTFLWSSSCDGSSNPRSLTYRGPSAASEPETRTMRALAAALRPEVYIDFHSFGRDVLRTYAPCANESPVIFSMLEHYVDDLRAPMNYSKRYPSASGEAPEDHWASYGALSFLIEISTSFQPSFSSTIAEEQRVWPGLNRILTAWRPMVRGHVRSIFQNEPIEATITYEPNFFSLGEKNMSRARDGRYAMWLPLGRTYQITFDAPGYQPTTKTVQIGEIYNRTTDLEVELVPDGIAPANIVKSGSEALGGTTTLTYTQTGEQGRPYWIAMSIGNTPGIDIGARNIPLNVDSLLLATAIPNALLMNNFGNLGAGGSAAATFPIPAIPALSGMTFWAGGITFDPSYNAGIKAFSDSIPINIQ